jgi:hypothetical protein
MSRNWLLVVASVAVAVSAVSAYLARPVVGGLVASETVRNLGRLPQGATVPVEFELVNRSFQPIEVIDVERSCTCAVSEPLKQVMGPGERCTMQVKWGTGSARGPFASSLAVVYKQGEERRVLKLQLEAVVEPDFTYEPRSLTFQAGRKAKKTITFAPGRRDVAVLAVLCNHRAFDVSVSKGGRQVEVVFDPENWPPENPVIELTVETDSPHERFCKLLLAVE